jgi:hypothetical protein
MSRIDIFIIILFFCLFINCSNNIVEKDLSISFETSNLERGHVGASYIIESKEGRPSYTIYKDSFVIQKILASSLKNTLFKDSLSVGWSCDLEDMKEEINFSDIERIFGKAFELLQYKKGDEKKALHFFIENYFNSGVVMVNSNPKWKDCEAVYFRLINLILQSSDERVINELSLARGLDICQLEELSGLSKKNIAEFSKSKFIISFTGCNYAAVSLNDDDILLENKPYFQVEFSNHSEFYLIPKITLLNPLSLFKSLEM